MAAYGAETEEDILDYAKKKNAIVVDLRSDTLSKPSKAMRDAMRDAIVGDDVYGEDPTVNALEEKAAEMLGKEAALFVSSGTMGNLIAMMVHCNERGCEAYCGEKSHTILHEQGGAAQIAGITLCPIPNDIDGSLNLSILESKLRTDRLHEPDSKLIIVESPINGRIVLQSWVERLSKLAKKKNLKMHLDGARLWNAVVELEIPVEKIVSYYDSVTFCLSKGLGAPIGSILCGDKSFVAKARRVRKVLGGGMRQVGIIAAAGIVALDETIPLLKQDHERALKFEKAFNDCYEKFKHSETKTLLNCTGRTNMRFLSIKRSKYTAKSFVKRLVEIEDGTDDPKIIVRAFAMNDQSVRFVFYRDIDDDLLEAAIKKVTYVLEH